MDRNHPVLKRHLMELLKEATDEEISACSRLPTFDEKCSIRDEEFGGEGEATRLAVLGTVGIITLIIILIFTISYFSQPTDTKSWGNSLMASVLTVIIGAPFTYIAIIGLMVNRVNITYDIQKLSKLKDDVLRRRNSRDGNEQSEQERLDHERQNAEEAKRQFEKEQEEDRIRSNSSAQSDNVNGEKKRPGYIILARIDEHSAQDHKFTVSIDSKESMLISRGETIRISIRPGLHTIYISVHKPLSSTNPIKSRIVEFEVAEDASCGFLCGSHTVAPADYTKQFMYLSGDICIWNESILRIKEYQEEVKAREQARRKVEEARKEAEDQARREQQRRQREQREQRGREEEQERRERDQEERESSSREISFRILGLNPETATKADIEEAFRKAAIRNHPDKCGNDPYAAERFRAIKNAYDALTGA